MSNSFKDKEPKSFDAAELEFTSALVPAIRREMQARFAHEGTGHDWAHIERVWRTSMYIGTVEGVDLELTALAALLHDIADHKFYNHSLSEGPKQAYEAVIEHGGTEELARKVALIVAEISYKGAGVDTPVGSREAAVVQDADRLDAIGAIGIARAFAYGGSKGRALYTPGESPVYHADFMSYATDNGTSINHFYEKLLLLKDRMHTATGRQLAEERHSFMEQFLAQFFKEWSGNDLVKDL